MKQDCTRMQGRPVLGHDINGVLANVLSEDTVGSALLPKES